MGFRDIVAYNVRRLRRRNRWTQEQLAQLLDRHKQTIWAIEASRQGINDRLMDDLAKVFGVSFSELVREEPHDQEAVEDAEPGSWDGGDAGYVAESRGRGCAGSERSFGAIEPEQVREWIRLAVREALEAALAEGASPSGEKGHRAGGADSPPGGRRRASRARGSDGRE